MRAPRLGLIVVVLNVLTAVAQNPIASRPYDAPEAYRIYSLLIAREEASGTKVPLVIREETDTSASAVGGACLSPEAAKRFKDSISDLERLRTKLWRLQRHFQIERPYEIVSGKDLASRAPLSGGYSFMSPVGFNKNKTLAIVYYGSICGGLCGQEKFHLLEKINGQWKEVPGVTGVTVS